jgi:UDP-N-acetylmuramyl pentapeptide phosphotransferase/UDP-N-acetylglucosamine-1-phosphate transferase
MLMALAVVVAGLAFWLTRALASGRGILVLDHPNDRSLHSRPTPRTGGIAIAAACLAGHVMLAVHGGVAAPAPWVLAAALALFAISLADDVCSVPALLRLLVHLGAAAVVVQAGVRVDSLVLPGVALALPAGLGAILSVLLLIWMINLYNFMDGMDGFAGGMGAMGFAAIAALSAAGGAQGLALSCVVIAAACAGFLPVNFPPARIFMGDAGSSVLGFLAGTALLQAQNDARLPLWLGVMVFSPFVVDATVTLLRRLMRGEAVWRAHRSHYYQRLVALGFGHRRTVLWEYLLMLLCTGAAALALRLEVVGQWLLLWGLLALYAILAAWVRRLEATQGPA